MISTQTNQAWSGARCGHAQAGSALMLMAALLLTFATATGVFAQRNFSRKYPARRNVKLQLTNLFGTITVETWERNEIKVSADMYPPIAPFTPEQTAEALIINVRNDNAGRSDVGDINFRITVPVSSSVDIETRRGNITVTGVRGTMVRAKVWTSGEIELSDIGASRVMAENITGNIFYDGQLTPGGKYEFKTVQGDVTIRIPADSAFSLMAAAPSTRRIDLGMFANPNLNLSDGRKVYGNVGNASCSLIVFNQRGSINFLRR